MSPSVLSKSSLSSSSSLLSPLWSSSSSLPSLSLLLLSPSSSNLCANYLYLANIKPKTSV